jgi:lipopolysaccharide export system permease protein
VEPQDVKTRGAFFSWYLTKYLSIEVLFSFLLGTGIFLLIMLMFQAIRLSEFVVVHQVSVSDVGRMSVYLMLSFLPIAVPIAFLFSVLMGISRANSEGEIMALQVNGISLKQIYLPVGIFSVMVSLLCLYTALYTVPQGNRSFELLITKLSSERVMSALKPGVFSEGFHGLTLLAEQVVPIKNEMKRVFIYDEREETHPLAITAQAGILRYRNDIGVLTMRLTDGSIYIDQKKNEQTVQQKIDFEMYDIKLDSEGRGGGGWRDYSPPSYNYPQLKQRLVEVEHDLPEHRKLSVELHKRFSLSFSCVIFAALGFFIGTLSQRGVRSTAIVFCMVVALVYWLAYVWANALAVSGWVAPWLGIWIPNVLFGAVSYLCYRYKVRV